MRVITKPDNGTITDHYNQLHLDEKVLWRLACEWNNQDPHIQPGKSVHLTDDNPFTSAWQECYDRKRAACPVAGPAT